MECSRSSLIQKKVVTAVRFELTPFRTGALNRRLRPLGHAALAYFSQDNPFHPTKNIERGQMNDVDFLHIELCEGEMFIRMKLISYLS